MDRKIYISVILPLKLEWEPCYWTDIGDIAVGQRVRVLFAGKEYTGTVSATGIEPLVAPSKIQQVISIEGRMAKILPEEIRFWRTLAGYYMCTVGEVYKSAYPAGKICSEEILAKREEKNTDPFRNFSNRYHYFIKVEKLAWSFAPLPTSSTV